MAMTYIITCYTTFSWFVNLYTRMHKDTKIQSTLPLTQPPSPPHKGEIPMRKTHPPTTCRPQVSHRTDRCVQSCEGNSPGQPLRSPHRRKSILSLDVCSKVYQLWVIKSSIPNQIAAFEMAIPKAVSYQYLIFLMVYTICLQRKSPCWMEDHSWSPQSMAYVPNHWSCS